MTNLDPKLINRTVIDQFGPKTYKSDRDRPIWTQNLGTGPLSTNLDPKPKNWTVIDQLGPQTSKSDHYRPIRTQNYKNRP